MLVLLKLTNKQAYQIWFTLVVIVFIYSLSSFWDEYQSEIKSQVNILDNMASKAAIKITKSASLEASRIRQLSDILSHYVPPFSNIKQAKENASPWLIKLNKGQLKQHNIEVVLVKSESGVALNGLGQLIEKPSTHIENQLFHWLNELDDRIYNHELIINSRNNNIDFYTFNRYKNTVVVIKFIIKIKVNELARLADEIFIIGEHNIPYTVHENKFMPIIMEFDEFSDLITDPDYIEHKVAMKPTHSIKVTHHKINNVDLKRLSTMPNKHFYYRYYSIEGTDLKLLLFYDAHIINDGINEELQEFAQITLVQVIIMVILTKLLQYHYKIQKLVHHDPLTNLLNRAHFKESICTLLQLHDRQKISHLGVLSLDIDKFKLINDNYGHGVGDEILKSLAKLMLNTCRNTDLVYRFGGEEFIIISVGENLQSLHQFAERICYEVEAQTETLDILPNGYTLSIGVAERMVNESIDDTIKRSDEMLYKAKNSGRNKVTSQ